MYSCNHCKKEFSDEPLYSITDELAYCSDECIPEDGSDHPYSFEYFNLVSSYRYFSSEMRHVIRLSDRVFLENEMDLVIEDFKSIYFGDSEGLYYKAKIISLYEKLLRLYEEVHNCLLHNDETYFAVIIRWDEIHNAIEDGLSTLIFEDILNESEFEYFEYKNLSWDASNKDDISPANFLDIVAFTDTKDQERFSAIVKEVFNKHQKGENSLQKGFDESVLDMFYCQIVKRCPVCGFWENEDDFVFDEEFNLSICNQNMDCRQ